ncbi:MAG TPA: sodium-dependent bicarbonate transport family permease [Candidatus Thiothrix moscowensis]|uniref:sodium-dependent bicarbonate transport family permease n=1 Tax=unclassified Thiothrix TaxID=2636184 RepID=UPI001A29FFEF|nr:MULTISPECIES: sodium-dependent bicarbonate transport family permease [unclassified Thiothrix]MBJ6608735.1 sodium-dependent bicarbonate transport family permease [Candidatus Thiothrix moscowensis]HRJ52642.1 sodium-dependent bicarbonate transport family permease [Candidatus Thiothrix moscowensis]HRJ92874.1 sodium-dependent bicarbonate transport family permease [Candidatus Thiothrix moscowensis]
MSIEPVVLFFVLGLAAGLLRSDLKIPGSIYDALSIYLLLAIGLKGGVKLAEQATPGMLLDGVLIIGAAILIPLVAFPVLRYLGKLKRADAASIAAHYGSVSVVTFSIGVAFLAQAAQEYEGYLIVFLVLLEVPALVIGVMLARYGAGQVRWGRMLHEVFFGKSIFLLLGGMIIGYVAGPQGIAPLDKVFFDLFKGALAIFLLEMGLVAAGRLADLRAYGVFLIGFGIVMPILSASLGTAVGWVLGLSVGGTMLLAALYASASYIAAPAAMRIAVPEANPGLSIGAALGVTFPFNILIGIPLYYWMAQTIHQIGA